MSDETERQKSHVEAGIVAMENLLDDGDYDDAVYVLVNVGVLLDALSGCKALTSGAKSRISIARDEIDVADILMERRAS